MAGGGPASRLRRSIVFAVSIERIPRPVSQPRSGTIHINVRRGDDGTVVAVSGEVDVCTEAPLQQALLRIMREHGARLLLDVSGVSFMDCACRRAPLTIRRRAELHGGFMRLIAVSRAVRRIIELTGAHEALAVERIATDRSA